MPGKVTFTDGSTITYTYAADGTKLQTVRTIGGTTTTTDYCGNAVYENGTLKYLLTEEGYVTLADKKYHYYLQDHQGNNRVVVDQAGNVEEVNHYYPFGGMFASTDVQPYKYNEKEFDEDTKWYDYGARNYDAALGRFIAVDPMAEMRYGMSPYLYSSGSPVNRVDETGMLDDWVEDRNKKIYWDPNATSQETTKAGETYLGKTVIDFKGSRQERLGVKNGKDGYIDGEGAVTADVTLYGPGGEDDIHHFTGYTMTSDPEKYGAIDEGIYDGNYDVNGKSGPLSSHWVLNHGNEVRMMDGRINPNAPRQVLPNGEGFKNGIFIHRTNWNGFAGGEVSKGCLLIAPNDWNTFDNAMRGARNFKVRVWRSNISWLPLQGVNGPIPNMTVLQRSVIY